MVRSAASCSVSCASYGRAVLHKTPFQMKQLPSSFIPLIKKKHPYIKIKRIILKNNRTESGKPLRLSDDMEKYKDVEVIQLAD